MPSFDDYLATAGALRDELDKIAEAELDQFDASSAFSRWVAREIEGVEGDAVSFTPGAEVLSFFVSEPEAVSVYSCAIAPDVTGDDGTPVWGTDLVERFFEELGAIASGSAAAMRDRNLKALSQWLSKDAEDDPNGVSTSATLAVMGELSLDARQRFEVLRRERSDLTAGIITWSDVRDRIVADEAAPPKNFHIDLVVDDLTTDTLKQRDWLVGLIHAKGLVEAMERHGVQLFDLNVRNELKKSKVNKEILKTIAHRAGRSNFHHLNNGVLVSCTSYGLKGKDRIRVHQPQIINGCQTVSSLHRSYQRLSEEERADFDSRVRVQVKLLQHPDPELLDQIVITTNNQNPMRPRNLRSNTPEQKLIQKGFRSFSEPWFYVRKDGEFDALCEGAHAKGFRRSLYQVDESARPVRFRTIDNVAVAKDWYSWIGAAPAVLRGGNDFFGDETLHRRVFSLRPAARHWEYFITDNFKDLDEDLFDAGPASASEYLLASAIAAYIRSSGLSPYRNKREALLRGLEQGALSGNHSIGNVTSSVAEQASFLAGDQRYMFNNYLNNIEDVLVELASFVVMQRAVRDGGGDPDELLVQPGVAEWTSSGFNAPVEDISARHPTGLLATLNASVRNAAEAYCANHADEIAAASRPKMFLGRRETIQEMRTYLT